MPTASEIHQITSQHTPDEVWAKAVDIIRHISPGYNFQLTRTVYIDVICLFQGEYPGYCAIKTPYHDLYHTLHVFLCAVRLLHGVHVSGTPLTDNEITMIILATLMHDIGYAQRLDEDFGTGAQHTLTHVNRGIQFMQQYLQAMDFTPEFIAQVKCLMNSTNPGIDFSSIDFPDQRTRMLAQIVGSSDIVGQMADRTYLEKLLFLYLEFKEAQFGNYSSMHDLLRQTKSFYDSTRAKKLDGAFDRIYNKLGAHFKAYLGVERNFYLEAIEKNIAYLSKVIALDETEYLSMLKRGGIIEKSNSLLSPAEQA